MCCARRPDGGARRNRTRGNYILPDHIMAVKCPGLTVSCSPKTKNKGPNKKQGSSREIGPNQGSCPQVRGPLWRRGCRQAGTAVLSRCCPLNISTYCSTANFQSVASDGRLARSVARTYSREHRDAKAPPEPPGCVRGLLRASNLQRPEQRAVRGNRYTARRHSPCGCQSWHRSTSNCLAWTGCTCLGRY